MSDAPSSPPDSPKAPRPLSGSAAGTIAILGRPNVGKSTLMNRIVGEKLAIVSPKPQTTRNRILGVWNGPAGSDGQPGSQIVFVDTPGVHAGRSGLNRFMVDEALSAIEQVDAVLLVVEAPDRAPAQGLPGGAASLPSAERRILEMAAQSRKPLILAINKVDTIKDKAALLPTLQAWNTRADFAALVPISAKNGTGIDNLVGALLSLLPAGPPLYGPDMLTDRTERFLVSELIREQLFLRLHQELPYATAVVVDNWEERPQGDVVIDATILVERDSQKGIVVGKAGSMIKDVGTAARAEINTLLGRVAHLRLQVKVAPDWTESPRELADLGYERTR